MCSRNADHTTLKMLRSEPGWTVRSSSNSSPYRSLHSRGYRRVIQWATRSFTKPPGVSVPFSRIVAGSRVLSAIPPRLPSLCDKDGGDPLEEAARSSLALQDERWRHKAFRGPSASRKDSRCHRSWRVHAWVHSPDLPEPEAEDRNNGHVPAVISRLLRVAYYFASRSYSTTQHERNDHSARNKFVPVTDRDSHHQFCAMLDAQGALLIENEKRQGTTSVVPKDIRSQLCITSMYAVICPQWRFSPASNVYRFGVCSRAAHISCGLLSVPANTATSRTTEQH